MLFNFEFHRHSLADALRKSTNPAHTFFQIPSSMNQVEFKRDQERKEL